MSISSCTDISFKYVHRKDFFLQAPQYEAPIMCELLFVSRLNQDKGKSYDPLVQVLVQIYYFIQGFRKCSNDIVKQFKSWLPCPLSDKSLIIEVFLKDNFWEKLEKSINLQG